MLYLYNTLSRKIEEFQPLKNKKVGLYTCGPTVYDWAHLGNLRSYIFEDILKRILLFNGYKVRHVMNITDVGHLTSDADEGEDKMEKSARREGKTAWEIAKFYTQQFKNNLKDLNILFPDIWCPATKYIKEQITLVQKLIDKGLTYQTSDGIYFNTSRLPDYGKLAGLKEQNLRAGARVKMGEKKNPHDFALWKFSPVKGKRQMEWQAFGKMGFPGWHIECSAMSLKFLGKQFDIHCGGIDHISVHHTNELAQSEAATGLKPWVSYWLHNEFLLVNEGKMAKSLKNFFTLSDIKNKGFQPLALRYFMLGAHYRAKLNFTWEALTGAQNALNNLYATIKGWEKRPKILKKEHGIKEFEDKFAKAVNNDLNTPKALAIVWELIKSELTDSSKAFLLLKFDKILGLDLEKYVGKKIKIPSQIRELLEERAAARKNKDWKKSDKVRRELRKMGYFVTDTKEGQGINN